MCRHLSHKSLSLGLHKWSRHPYTDTNICCAMPFIHAIPGKLKARSNVTQVKGDQYVQRWTHNMSYSILVSILGDRFPLSSSLWLWLWLSLSRALSPPPLPLSLSLCLSLFQQCGIQYECEAWNCSHFAIMRGTQRGEQRIWLTELESSSWLCLIPNF